MVQSLAQGQDVDPCNVADVINKGSSVNSSDDVLSSCVSWFKKNGTPNIKHYC